LGHPAEDVAPRLLGAVLRHETPEGAVAVRLTEVEAYAGARDPGSHAFRGRTRRNATMFGPPGRLYVYFTYGMHWCANVVCGPEGTSSAVLLRAGTVVEGLPLARSRRPGARRDTDLARGPARLTSALGIGREHDGADLDPQPPDGDLAVPVPADRLALYLPRRRLPAGSIRTGPRVGVSGPGGDGLAFPWRFWIDADPTVSVYRPGKPRRGRVAVSETLPADT
ncbi:MAG TPA: DNA-3-methyladenine glycosylase, partial [Kineosporiaceae bacterium]|nr:DNA-3-methyladenine glycosylase [Kineosporiaceae bacterium]